MQPLTEKMLRLAPPGGFFDMAVISNLFPELSPTARKASVHRAFKQNEILRLKPSLYCLAEVFRKSEIHPFSMAGILVSPSHISLESALSYHGLIPEAVYQVTAVCNGRSRQFTTPFGVFVYKTVPATFPKAGVRDVEVSPNSWAFIAQPARAIADLIYLRREVHWNQTDIRFLTDSMRIEEEDLFQLPVSEIDEVIQSLRNKRTLNFMECLKKEIQ